MGKISEQMFHQRTSTMTNKPLKIFSLSLGKCIKKEEEQVGMATPYLWEWLK